MIYKDKVKEIKKALLRGGLVVCGSGMGKTKAIAEILVQKQFAVAIVETKSHAKLLTEYLQANHGFTDSACRAQILIPKRVDRFLMGRGRDYAYNFFM